MPLKYERLVDDTESIRDDEIVFRRVSWQGVGGRDRVPEGEAAPLTGNAFSDYSADHAASLGYPAPCMSVAVQSILVAEGKDASIELDGFPDAGMACITAGELRNLARRNGDLCPQGIMLAPEEGRPWHAVVFDLSGGRRSNAVKDAVAAAARWHIPLNR